MGTKNEKWQAGFACRRHGFGISWGGLDDCPNHGSSDCPITMREHAGETARRCESEEFYDYLTEVLRHWRGC